MLEQNVFTSAREDGRSPCIPQPWVLPGVRIYVGSCWLKSSTRILKIQLNGETARLSEGDESGLLQGGYPVFTFHLVFKDILKSIFRAKSFTFSACLYFDVGRCAAHSLLRGQVVAVSSPLRYIKWKLQVFTVKGATVVLISQRRSGFLGELLAKLHLVWAVCGIKAGLQHHLGEDLQSVVDYFLRIFSVRLAVTFFPTDIAAAVDFLSSEAFFWNIALRNCPQMTKMISSWSKAEGQLVGLILLLQILSLWWLCSSNWPEQDFQVIDKGCMLSSQNKK